MKFDYVVMNPPYQDPNNKKNPLWQKFIKKSLLLIKKNGFVVSINPSSWRKPNHKILNIFKNYSMKYIEIHNQQDGLKTFGCGTRFDWFILKNNQEKNETKIVFEDNDVKNIDFKSFEFIPNFNLEKIEKCIAKNKQEKLNIIHSRSDYGNDKKWMSKEKNEKHYLPCVYSTPAKKEPKILYSSKNNGHFGIKKIIIGKASPENCFYDKGNYGVTNNCIAIVVENETEANNIIKAIKSEEFKNIINKSCKWAGFSIEPEVFNSLKKDFWKEFI